VLERGLRPEPGLDLGLDLGEEAQESAGWGSNRKLFRFSAPFEGAPQYITLYSSYLQPLPDQHVYGGGNDPLALNYGAIFPSGTASVATRPAPFGYDTRRILVGNGMAQPGLDSYEPAFADETAVLMAHAFERIQAEDGGATYLRLSTRSLTQPERTDEAWRAGCVEGGYWLKPPAPDARMALVYSGAIAPAARNKASALGNCCLLRAS